MRSQGPRILVVDDESNICWVLKEALARDGYQVDVATSASEAESQLGQAYDVAVVDVRLPGADGLELARRMREAHPTTRVIVLSGWATDPAPLIEERLEAGMYASFIGKPFHLAEVRQRVREALSGRP